MEGAELHSDLGGLWNRSHPDSPAYDSLKMDTSRATSHFGTPGAKGQWPDYFDRETAFRFLDDYASRHSLRQRIRFGTAVTSIRRDASGAWNVGFSDSSSRLYRAVVIATGKHSRRSAKVPKELAAQAETAGVRWIHASAYRNGAQSGLVDKRVLIVGGSNTAVDLATELSSVAAKVWLSVRSTRWLIPEYVFGIPADEFAANGPKLPYWIEIRLFSLLQRWLVGRPQSFGFAPPDHGLLEKLPVPDRGIVKALREGKVALRSDVEEIESDGSVHFVPSLQPSAEIVRPEVVVFATGYDRQFPFLDRAYRNFNSAGELPLLTFHPTERGLFFLIEPTVPEGSWPILAESAETVAVYLAAEASGGHESALAQFDQARLTPAPDYKGSLFRAANDLHVDPKRFRQFHADARAFFRESR